MLLNTRANPPVVLVDSVRLLPRYWAAAWSIGFAGRSPAENTLMMRLRHIGAFYDHCDERFGQDALDEAISHRNASGLRSMLESFYLQLTASPDYTTTTVQRWDSARQFTLDIVTQQGVQSEVHRALASAIDAFGRIRTPRRGRFRFARALPSATLVDLLEVASPNSPRNPFKSENARWRNWLILNLLLMCGLRRGEAMLLKVDSLKRDADPHSGHWVYWLDVTTTEDDDTRARKPSIKTEESHRQIPVSADLADLYDRYLSDFRQDNGRHGFLLTSRDGHPLSAESFSKMFEALTEALAPLPRTRFNERTGGKRHISPHDLRHTCATARYTMFIAQDPERELAMQRMRAFFGWSVHSKMPELYARAAIQDDLMRTWRDLFDSRVDVLRAL
jgi:integrase